MKISDGIIKRSAVMLQKHLKDYQVEIDHAYCSTDDALDVTLKIKFRPEGNGIQLDTSIAFVSRKIKDSATEYIDENQRQLFDSVEAMRPKKEDGIDKITISSGDKSVELEAE